MAKHIVYLEKERETKNFVRYEEVVPEDGEVIMGKQYIAKAALEILGNPKTLKITIEAEG
jgi:high-affinity K+ transport system ATPase subunit B